MNKLNAIFALAAGLIGGVFSHCLWPQPVQAQTQIAQATPTRQIRAQTFALVDAKGVTMSVFAVGKPVRPNDAPTIVLYNSLGHEIWQAGGTIRPTE
jgi:hypothetical protein